MNDIVVSDSQATPLKESKIKVSINLQFSLIGTFSKKPKLGSKEIQGNEILRLTIE